MSILDFEDELSIYETYITGLYIILVDICHRLYSRETTEFETVVNSTNLLQKWLQSVI
jgi:hypothetical protein